MELSNDHRGSASIAHLVIVAGASGSGKSTFVHQLRARDLPPEINALLPGDVADWPVVGTTMKPDFPRPARGVLFQYDMNGRGVAAGREFSEDPALSDVGFAKTVTVINLRPSPDLMIDQLVAREGNGRTKEEILRETFAWRSLRKWYIARRILARWKPWIALNRRYSCRRKINLYNQDGWLDSFYKRWQAYLQSLTAKGVAVEQIFLEPDLGTQVGNSYAWRIVPDAEKAAPSQTTNREAHSILNEGRWAS